MKNTVLERNKDVKERDLIGGDVIGEFDGGMKRVEKVDEMDEVIAAVCPDEKNVVDVSKPYKG